jgi:hypothetical protein
MSKILLLFLAVCAGTVGFRAFHRAAAHTRASAAAMESERRLRTNRLATAQAAAVAERREVARRQDLLRQAVRRPDLSPELVTFLVGGAQPAAAPRPRGLQEALLAEAEAQRLKSQLSAELRQALGIGWDSSPDYLLIRKDALKQLDFQRLDAMAGLAPATCDLLALSPDEQAALQSALDRAKEAVWARVQRTEPSGDVVAQYTFPALDSAFAQSLSNSFSADVDSAIAPERTDLFLHGGWNELKWDLNAPGETQTLTIRKTVVDGEPDLVCDVNTGGNVQSSPVRYARYPFGPDILLFFQPLGWDTLAQQAGFTLPPRFYGQQ